MVLLLIPRSFLPGVWAGRRTEKTAEIRGFRVVLAMVIRTYCALWHRLAVDRWAPLPPSGPAILISNHTCGIDHLLLQASSRRVLGFMIAREYYEWWWLRRWCEYVGCIPVNRDGRDVAAIRSALRALSEGRVLPIFPEGHIVPCSGRRLGEIKPGSAYLAIRAQAPVIPAYIAGTPPTDSIVTSLTTPSRARVTFGDPIDLSDIPVDQAGDRAVQAVVSERFEKALLALQARLLSENNGDGALERT
jgi:1-acyl-sn-glycerol-3-phosphate acyltransferase